MSQGGASHARGRPPHHTVPPEKRPSKKTNTVTEEEATPALPTKRARRASSACAEPDLAQGPLECAKCKALEQELMEFHNRQSYNRVCDHPIRRRRTDTRADYNPYRFASEYRPLYECPVCDKGEVQIIFSKPSDTSSAPAAPYSAPAAPYSAPAAPYSDCEKCNALEQELHKCRSFEPRPGHKSTTGRTEQGGPRSFVRPSSCEWETMSSPSKSKSSCQKCTTLEKDIWHDHRATGVFPPRDGPFSATSRQSATSSPDYVPFNFDTKTSNQGSGRSNECSQCPVVLSNLLSGCMYNGGLQTRRSDNPPQARPVVNQGPPYVPFQIGSQDLASTSKVGHLQCECASKNTDGGPTSRSSSSDEQQWMRCEFRGIPCCACNKSHGNRNHCH